MLRSIVAPIYLMLSVGLGFKLNEYGLFRGSESIACALPLSQRSNHARYVAQ